MPSRLSVALALSFFWLFVACHADTLVAPLAIRLAAEKSPGLIGSKLARRASKTLCETLQSARYADLPEALRPLTAAYLDNPADPEIALLLAHSHPWTLSERTSRTGYFQLRKSVRRYPEFNGFSAAFPLSGQPRDSDRFAEAVDLMWLNLEECGGDDFDRASLDEAGVMDSRTASGRKCVCWNTERVPHDFEGLFLFMGDRLTNAGDVDNAARAYQAAKLTPEFSDWRFTPVLEARLANLDARAVAFARAEHPGEEPEMMFGSDYACAGYHAR